MMIRLEGTASECATTVELLRVLDDLIVLGLSGTMPVRGDSQLVRMRVEVVVLNADVEVTR